MDTTTAAAAAKGMDMSDRLELFEDNAGGLTVTYKGETYTGLEHLSDETRLADLKAVLDGVFVGDLDFFRSAEPVTEYDELVATIDDDEELWVSDRIGIAGRRLVGEVSSDETPKRYVVIEEVRDEYGDATIWPVTTHEEIEAAEVALRDAGVASAKVLTGTPPDVVETGTVILAAEGGAS